ncbi:unnamed protein product [Caenorhabditis auriculariae]|uniref:Uncharacterized protein n=1 Tax=Caenorhabditis auriculariae TaxID=2777116 RepID=A0A8S1H6Y6_9PELO|nr:unnamed protein product [Caenorhabditis auriculariae]
MGHLTYEIQWILSFLLAFSRQFPLSLVVIFTGHIISSCFSTRLADLFGVQLSSGCMALLEQLFLILLYMTALQTSSLDNKISDKDVENMINVGTSKYFELDKHKLGQLWQFATARATIKAQARAAYPYVSQVEKIVFEQCSKEAKTVVALARCAVRLFNEKRFRKEQLPKEKPPPRKSTIKISRRPLKKERVLQQDFKYNTLQNVNRADTDSKNTLTETKIKLNHEEKEDSYYYSSSKSKWVRNPIRKQVRSQIRQKRKVDDIMLAYDMFLNEQRQLKKMEDSRKKEEKTRKSIPERPNKRPKSYNNYGLPHIISKLRQKRDVPVKLEERPAIDFQKLASKFLDDLGLGIDSRAPQVDTQKDALEKIIDIINEYSASELSPSKFSVMSPRILSLFPDKSKKNRLFSPSILSFQKDGFFSLPELFDMITSNQRYQQLMLEGIMDLSGAGSVVEKLLTTLEPKMKSMDEEQYPFVQKMSLQERNWLRAKSSFSSDQLKEMDEFGIVHMDEQQLRLVYGDEADRFVHIANLTREERINRVENDIRKLAAKGRPQWPYFGKGGFRGKRETHGGHDNDGDDNIPNYPHPEEINGVEYQTLKMVEVLTPRFLEPRVLSPETLVIDVLSPGFLSPHVLSPESIGVMILSPNVLSPRVASDEKMIVEVLSPHILGGPHSEEEEEHGVLEVGSKSETDHEHLGHNHGHNNHESPTAHTEAPVQPVRSPFIR